MRGSTAGTLTNCHSMKQKHVLDFILPSAVVLTAVLQRVAVSVCAPQFKRESEVKL